MGGVSVAEYRDERMHAVRDAYHAAFGDGGPPLPVHAIAEDWLGLRVTEEPLNGPSGYLLPGKHRIVLSANDPPDRRRFTLAHELGHYVCRCAGRVDMTPIYCRREEVGADPASTALEREANIFAAELLMPEEAVRAVRGGSLPAAAGCFGVSALAVHLRLYSFGLIAEQPE